MGTLKNHTKTPPDFSAIVNGENSLIYVGRGLAPAASPEKSKSADALVYLRILLYNDNGDIYGKRSASKKASSLETLRLQQAGAYYVTICTQNRHCLLSRIIGGGMEPAKIQYTPYGKIAEEQLFLLEKRYPFLRIDQYVIMPNHIHVIFVLEEAAGVSKGIPFGHNPRPTTTDIVCAYKSLTTGQCKKVRPIDKLFQTSFYEHVIRRQEDYEEIAEYIMNNPKQWELDKLYSKE